MPRYQAQLLMAPATTTLKTVGALWASSGTRARRMMVYEYVLGQTGGLSSTDCQVFFDMTRFTTTSLLSATAFTPSPTDTADDATLAVFQINAATEFAAVAAAGAGLNLVSEAQNQRATFRFRALETYDMYVIPATNLSGIAWRAGSSNFTASVLGQMVYLE